MRDSRELDNPIKASTVQSRRHHALAFHPRFDKLFSEAFTDKAESKTTLDQPKAPKSKAEVRDLRENSKDQDPTQYTMHHAMGLDAQDESPLSMMDLLNDL